MGWSGKDCMCLPEKQDQKKRGGKGEAERSSQKHRLRYSRPEPSQVETDKSQERDKISALEYLRKDTFSRSDSKTHTKTTFSSTQKHILHLQIP